MEFKLKAPPRISIIIRVAGIVLAVMLLTGIYEEWTAMLVARVSDTGGDMVLSSEVCETVPCEWQIQIDCDGRITWMGGSAGDGSGVNVEFRPDP